MNLQDIIRAVQVKVGAAPDGAAGPETWSDIYQALFGHAYAEAPSQTSQPRSIPGVPDSDRVDTRSETAIATLLPEVRPYARALIHAAAGQGITAKVTSGTRTYAEQDALFLQRPAVTHARGGQSNHNFGIAFDLTIFDSADRPVWESPAYKALGSLGKGLGLSWGGDWTSIDDEPHFELRPSWARSMSEGGMLAELRNRHESGQAVFT